MKGDDDMADIVQICNPNCKKLKSVMHPITDICICKKNTLSKSIYNVSDPIIPNKGKISDMLLVKKSCMLKWITRDFPAGPAYTGGFIVAGDSIVIRYDIGIVFGVRHTVLRSSDGGESWHVIPLGQPNALWARGAYGNGKIVLCGRSTLNINLFETVVSDDLGLTWVSSTTEIPPPTPGTPVSHIEAAALTFDKSKGMFVALFRRGMIGTSIDGISWNTQQIIEPSTVGHLIANAAYHNGLCTFISNITTLPTFAPNRHVSIRSKDLIQWSVEDIITSIPFACNDSGMYMFLPANHWGNPHSLSTYDFVNWEQHEVPPLPFGNFAPHWQNIVAADDLFISTNTSTNTGVESAVFINGKWCPVSAPENQTFTAMRNSQLVYVPKFQRVINWHAGGNRVLTMDLEME